MWAVAVFRSFDSDDNFYIGPFPTKGRAQDFIESAHDDADDSYSEPSALHLYTADVEYASVVFINIPDGIKIVEE